MDDFDDLDLGLDDPELGIDDPDLLGDADVPDVDAVVDPTMFVPGVDEVLPEPPLDPGVLLGPDIEDRIDPGWWDPVVEDPELGVMGTLSFGSVVAGGARIVGAVKSARDVVSLTRSIRKKVGERLPSRRGHSRHDESDG
jgi:hypothetical protein